jgi:hypothetical protein
MPSEQVSRLTAGEQKRIEFLQKEVQTKDAGCGRSGRQPASVWRVLKQAGLLLRSKGKASRRRIGFEHALQPHQQLAYRCFLHQPILSSKNQHGHSSGHKEQGHKSMASGFAWPRTVT